MAGDYAGMSPHVPEHRDQRVRLKAAPASEKGFERGSFPARDLERLVERAVEQVREQIDSRRILDELADGGRQWIGIRQLLEAPCLGGDPPLDRARHLSLRPALALVLRPPSRFVQQFMPARLGVERAGAVTV